MKTKGKEIILINQWQLKNLFFFCFEENNLKLINNKKKLLF